MTNGWAVLVPTFDGTDEPGNDNILERVRDYILNLTKTADVSAFIHKTPFNAPGQQMIGEVKELDPQE